MNNSWIVKVSKMRKILNKWQSYDWRLTRNNEGVDGDPVILVLLVGVGAPQPEPGEEGAEEVADEADDDEGCHEADVAWELENQFSPVFSSLSRSELQRVWVFFCLFIVFIFCLQSN